MSEIIYDGGIHVVAEGECGPVRNREDRGVEGQAGEGVVDIRFDGFERRVDPNDVVRNTHEI